MRIVIISDWFAEKMGYAENCLPKALASLGHEVHLVTSNVQVYFNSATYKEIYEPFIGPGVVSCGVKEFDGYTLHRLPYAQWRGQLYIKGLLRRLFAIQPQIVQTFDVLSLTTYEAALAKPFLGFKLFLESHMHASVFHPATRRGGIRERFNWLVYGATIGHLVSSLSEKCYPISIDAADVAVRFFGVERRKVNICSLGVDTDLFRQVSDEASQRVRLQLRQQLGFSESDIVCIYTGRFSKDKNPLCLAQAIGSLVAHGEPFRGLFVGSGTQTDVVAIQACPGCVVHPFVPVLELPPFYWAADIGVWPKQESTSQLDAAACGLERTDGNGLTYDEGDVFDLAQTIRMLADPNLRRRMGDIGSRKMREHFSWDRIAGQRIQDYEAALR
jgi:glycosyltransferase involved in cell wall biosynthesis